jgi:hypothetical protein
MKTKLLYIDIDGVLLGQDKYDVCLAKHAKEFLAFCLENFKCYWLSTHSKDGNVAGVIKALKPYCDDYFLRLAEQVRPASWVTLKTEAIDLASDFYWLDDSPLQYEIDYLKANGRIDRWIDICSRTNPDALKEVMKMLQEK